VPSYARIRELIAAGMDVARLNSSHGDCKMRQEFEVDEERLRANLDALADALAREGLLEREGG
jgi:pyruvate kinase